MSAAEPSALAQTVARARRDMQGKLDRRAALTASLRLATSDAERRALLSLYETTQLQLMVEKTRPKITLEQFEFLAQIGRGGFGEVSLVRREGVLYGALGLSQGSAAGSPPRCLPHPHAPHFYSHPSAEAHPP